MQSKVSQLIASRAEIIAALTDLAPLGLGSVIGGNDANFIVLPILSGPGGEPDNTRAHAVYKRMAEECGVVVRYRGGEHGCKGCVRITIGTTEENAVMLKRLEESLRLGLAA